MIKAAGPTGITLKKDCRIGESLPAARAPEIQRQNPKACHDRCNL
jgi:hypothetical protein